MSVAWTAFEGLLTLEDLYDLAFQHPHCCSQNYTQLKPWNKITVCGLATRKKSTQLTHSQVGFHTDPSDPSSWSWGPNLGDLVLREIQVDQRSQRKQLLQVLEATVFLETPRGWWLTDFQTNLPALRFKSAFLGNPSAVEPHHPRGALRRLPAVLRTTRVEEMAAMEAGQNSACGAPSLWRSQVISISWWKLKD